MSLLELEVEQVWLRAYLMVPRLGELLGSSV